MKILHTADVHLHSSHPQRLDALAKVLAKAREYQVDLLLIAGDLFDNHQEADKLRPTLRSLFRDLPFEVLAIPGNHDQHAYSRDHFFGDSFQGVTKQPFSVVDYPGTRLVLLPYFPGPLLPLLADLQKQVTSDKLNILVLHCTWSLPHYTSLDFGTPDDHRYLPVTPDLLDSLGYDLLLAGHYHSGYRKQTLPRGGVFVYSGSPSPITTREQGRRHVNLVTHGDCRSLELPVRYRETITLPGTPGKEQALLEQLKETLALHPPNLCRPLVRIEGFTAWDEAHFHQAVKECAQGREIDLDYACKGVGSILQDPLYQRLLGKLIDPQEPTLNLILETFSRQAAGERA